MIRDEESAKEYVTDFCADRQFGHLERLVAMLIAENQEQNLVSNSSLEHVWRRHIADSIQLVEHVPRETPVWLDLGTGAGFPGLLIAMIREDQRTYLVEPRRKRVLWLEKLKAEFRLKNCTILGKRLETVQPFETTVISARAFAPLPKLLELASPFATSDTVFVLPKGKSAKREVESLKSQDLKRFHVEQSRTEDSAEIIVGSLKGRDR